MKRREFITLLGGATAWPLAARAQQQPIQIKRIGILQGSEAGDPVGQNRIAAFVQGLRDLGWTDRANVAIDYRWGGSDSERIRLYAAELTGLAPDVIWTTGSLPLLPLKRATRTVPIVFTSVYDPVGSGFVASLAQPGGNITGFTLGEFSMGGKMLEVLKEVTPKVSRVAIVLNLDQPPHVAMWRAVEATAPSLAARGSFAQGPGMLIGLASRANCSPKWLSSISGFAVGTEAYSASD
jgi:putative tryptophan/tyrosine transport system substrate-binding protein